MEGDKYHNTDSADVFYDEGEKTLPNESSWNVPYN